MVPYELPPKCLCTSEAGRNLSQVWGVFFFCVADTVSTSQHLPTSSDASNNSMSPFGLDIIGWIIAISVTCALVVGLLIVVVVLACRLRRLKQRDAKNKTAYDVWFSHESARQRTAAAAANATMRPTTTAEVPSATEMDDRVRSGQTGRHQNRDNYTTSDDQSQNSADTVDTVASVEYDRYGKKYYVAATAPSLHHQHQQHKDGAAPSTTTVQQGHQPVGSQDGVHPRHSHHMTYYYGVR